MYNRLLRVLSPDEISYGIRWTRLPPARITVYRFRNGTLLVTALAYFVDDKVVVYILAWSRRVAISLQSKRSEIKFNI